MKRKAEITGQVLAYLIALIIFSLILLYGYKIIFKFKGDADRITATQLSADMKDAVKKVGSEFGTVARKSAKIPGEATNACFLDMIWASGASQPNDFSGQGICGGDIGSRSDENIGLCDAWKEAEGANMYLLDRNQITADPVDIGPVRIGLSGGSDSYDSNKPHYLCLPVLNGKIEFRLRGLGDSVELSE